MQVIYGRLLPKSLVKFDLKTWWAFYQRNALVCLFEVKVKSFINFIFIVILLSTEAEEDLVVSLMLIDTKNKIFAVYFE